MGDEECGHFEMYEMFHNFQYDDFKVNSKIVVYHELLLLNGMIKIISMFKKFCTLITLLTEHVIVNVLKKKICVLMQNLK